MPERCPACSEELLPRPCEKSHVVFLRAESGAIIIADAEHTLHKCGSLTRRDEIELLKDANVLFGNELDEL